MALSDLEIAQGTYCFYVVSRKGKNYFSVNADNPMDAMNLALLHPDFIQSDASRIHLMDREEVEEVMRENGMFASKIDEGIIVEGKEIQSDIVE